MPGAENLFETTRGLLTADSVRRFSLALNEPRDKVAAGLNSVVPTLVTGFINEGSTSQGARKIVHLLQVQDFDSELPQNLNDQNYLSKGENVVEDIFGDHFHSLASDLTPSTGLKSENVERMMEMVAPVVLGVIGSKIKDENMNDESLNGFFREHKTMTDKSFKKKKPPFFGMVAAGLLVLTVMFWFFSTRVPPVSTMTRDLASLERSVTNSPVVISNGLTINELPSFLNRKVSPGELPKRFAITGVNFVSGSTDFSPGSDKELNMMAGALKRYPGAYAKIEAYVEDTGDEDENLLLSENRAMLIREELIGRGVEPSRIRAEGRGPRGDKRQAYFVITRIK